MADDFDQLFANGSGKAMPAPSAGSAPASAGGDDFDHIFAKGSASDSAMRTAAQPFVGFNEGLANTVGAPVDVLNWGMRKAGLPVSDQPVMGSDWIKHKLGTDQPMFQPQSSGERLMRSAGEGMASALVPEAGVQGVARSAGMKVAPALEALVGSGASTGASAVNAGAGAAGAVAGDVAADAAPDRFKPLAGMLGSLAGGVGTGAGAVGVRAATDAAAPAVRKFAEPFTAAGRQAGVARQMVEGSTDPHAALNALEDAADQAAQAGRQTGETAVPGERFTTGQITQDPGLLANERAASTKSVEDFKTNQWGTGADQQAAARDEAFRNLQQQGAPEDVAAFLRQRQRDLDSMGQQAEGLLQGRAQTAADAMGPSQTPEATGADLRQPVMDRLGQARSDEQALWRLVPDHVQLPAGPIQEAANKIAGQLTAASGGLTPREQAIFSDLGGYSDYMPLRDAQQLSSRISKNVRQLQASPGERDDQAIRRLTLLKGAVEGSIDNAVANQVALERAAVMRGAMAVGDTIDARLKDFIDSITRNPAANGRASGAFPGMAADGNSGFGGAAFPADQGPGSGPLVSGIPASEGRRAPQSLIDFARKAGGVQDPGGDLAAMGLQKIVNNKTGVPLDDFRQRAAEAGYLGGDTDRAMSETTTNDLLDALSQGEHVYSVHDEGQLANHQAWKQQQDAAAQDRQARSQILDQLNQMGLGQPDRATLREAVRLMREERMPWDNALEQAQIKQYNAGQDALASRSDRLANAVPDYDLFPGDPNYQPQGQSSSSPLALVTPQDADKLRAARAATLDRKTTFGTGVAGQLVRQDANGFKVPDAGVGRKVFKRGPEGGETLRAYLKASGADGVTPAVNAAADSLRQTATNPGGLIDPKKFAKWRQDHAPALRELPPDAVQRFSDAATATQTLNDFAARRAQAMKDWQNGAIGKVMGVSDPADVTKVVGRIFQAPDAVKQMTALAREAGKDATAREGLKRSVSDYMADTLTSALQNARTNAANFKPAMYVKFVRQQEPVLRAAGMDDAQIRMLQDIASGIEKSASTLAATRLPGQSNTAADLSGLLTRMADKQHDAGWVTAALGGLLTGHLGVATGAVGKGLSEMLRGRGLDKMSELTREAVYNPDFGRAMMLLGTSNKAALRKISEVKLRRVLARQGFVAGVRAANADDERQGFAKGGQVTPPATVAPDFMQQITSALRSRLLAGAALPAVPKGSLAQFAAGQNRPAAPWQSAPGR